MRRVVRWVWFTWVTMCSPSHIIMEVVNLFYVAIPHNQTSFCGEVIHRSLAQTVEVSLMKVD